MSHTKKSTKQESHATPGSLSSSHAYDEHLNNIMTTLQEITTKIFGLATIMHSQHIHLDTKLTGSVKKCSSLCKVAGTRDWISRVARGLQAARSCRCAKHVEKLKRHVSWSTTGQNVQTSHLVSSRLELTAQSSREVKLPTSSVLERPTLRIPNTHKYKYPSYP